MSNQTTADGGQEAKTGTTTVGLVADGGVVLAADRRASLGGGFVANKDVSKIEQVHPTAATTISGSVGAAQTLLRQLRAEASLYENRRGCPMSVSALATAAGDALRGHPVGLVLGGVDDEGPQVYELDGGGGVLADDYAATGSGMQLAYGVLERRYDPDGSLDDAAATAAAAVDAASERDTASGNGLTMARVTAEGVDVQTSADPAEVT